MKQYDVFAKPIGSGPEQEFLALHNFSGDLEMVKGFAASRGCEITRIYDLSQAIEKPNFINAINI